jgi:hypothetical protein
MHTATFLQDLAVVMIVAGLVTILFSSARWGVSALQDRSSWRAIGGSLFPAGTLLVAALFLIENLIRIVRRESCPKPLEPSSAAER